MKSGFLLLILLPGFCTPAFSEMPAGDFEAPPAVNAEELLVIRDKLSTSLFFKGELADSIIDSGLQDRLVKLTGRETRSEVRLALIGWIKNDPERAAKIYFYLKNRRLGTAGSSEVINYKMPSWEINPHFLELIRGVNRAAKDASISDEEMSLAAQRLFEGPQARPEVYTPWMPGMDGGPRPFGPGTEAYDPASISIGAGDEPKGRGGHAARGAGDAGAVSYADYRLNPASVERESRALGGWFESVKSAMEAGIGDTAKEKGLANPRGLFDETFSIYRNFVVELSGLKGRNKITRTEAVRLEALRRSLRKNLGELETLSIMRRINERAQSLPARSPGVEALRDDARRIEIALKAFLDDLRDNPESVRSAGGRLYELKKAFGFWTLRFSAHGRLADLKDRITGLGFSCVLDKFIFKYLSRFHPSTAYVRLEAGLASRASAIDISLEGVAAGDYETAAFFSPGEKKPLSARILEAENEAARLEAYSRFNRRLQFFFWDVFANPFGLAPGPKGISAGNKLLF